MPHPPGICCAQHACRIVKAWEFRWSNLLNQAILVWIRIAQLFKPRLRRKNTNLVARGNCLAHRIAERTSRWVIRPGVDSTEEKNVHSIEMWTKSSYCRAG